MSKANNLDSDYEKQEDFEPIKMENDFLVNKFLQPHGLKISNSHEDLLFLQELVNQS